MIGIAAREWPLDLTHVLDLAAGSGEVTLALQTNHVAWASRPRDEKNLVRETPTPRMSAIDPYTAQAFTDRTKLPCETLSFEDIAAGAIRGRSYSLIVCSFAMHLCDESRLPALCWALAEVSRQLLILTPHKRPIIKPEWGWRLERERVHERIRARLYLATT